MNKNKKTELAERLQRVTAEAKGLADEIDEIRGQLFAAMVPGEVVHFETPTGTWRVKVCETEETVLNDPKAILDTVGQKIFLDSVKVGIALLKKALKAHVEAPEIRDQIMSMCVKGIIKNAVLKLLQGRE